MDRLKRYIDLYWPVEYCNLSCAYCYIRQHRKNRVARYQCSHTAQEIRKALSKERLGGCCLLNICAGGETMLEPEILPIVRALLIEGHYVSIVTNGTVLKTMRPLLELPIELSKRLFLKFSFHYDELKEKNLLDSFVKMVKKAREKMISVSVELPAFDPFLQEEKEIIEFSKEHFGVLPHVAALRDESKAGFSILSDYSFSELNARWGMWKSPLFEVRSEIMEKKYKGFCYAGEWTAAINLENGEIKQCYYEPVIDNLYKNIDKPILWAPVGNQCRSEYCYACHAFLTLGDMPGLKLKYTYSDTRDRDGIWLEPDMKAFMSQRLWENNKQYGWMRKRKIDQKNKAAAQGEYEIPQQFAKNLIIQMKNEKEKNSYVLLEARHRAKMMYQRVPKELTWIKHSYHGTSMRGGVKNKLQIYALEEQDPQAVGNEIGIVGVIADNVWYDAIDLFEPVWIVKNRMLFWNGYSGLTVKKISGFMPDSKKLVLILEKNRWRGMCMVEYRGRKRQWNCFENVDDDILMIPF